MCIRDRYGVGDTYTFPHLTLQEFLAAVHVARLEKFEQLHIIETSCNKKHLSVVWRFLCGMLDYTSDSSVDTFKNLMERTEDELFKLQCCHESQCASLCTHVINTFGSRVVFNASNNLSPSDCVAIGYAINKSKCQTVISFDGCQLSSEGTVALLQFGDNPFSLEFK